MADHPTSQPNTADSDPKPSLRSRFFRSLRNGFLAGMIIAIPIAVTIWLITFFVGFVDEKVLALVPDRLNPNLRLAEVFGFGIPGIGLIIAVIVVWMLGVLASNIIGTSVLKFGEHLVSRVPLVSNVYKALKQIVQTVAMQKDRAFKEVCLIEYPRKGLWAVGFVTSDLKGAPADVLPAGHVCVFVPTTPNPTSGFLLFVPRDQIKILDMTPEQGAKLIISGGMVATDEEFEEKE